MSYPPCDTPRMKDMVASGVSGDFARLSEAKSREASGLRALERRFWTVAGIRGQTIPAEFLLTPPKTNPNPPGIRVKQTRTNRVAGGCLMENAPQQAPERQNQSVTLG